MKPAEKTDRIIHYMTDNLMITLISFEGFLGKTPGKMVTGSFVLGNKGLKPCWWQVILRTLLRLTGFDILSFLFGVQFGLHDILTNTFVANSKTKFEII